MNRTLALVPAVAMATLLAGCGGGEASPAAPPAPATVTVTVPVPAPASSSAQVPVTTVTLPEVAGRNGAIVDQELRSLGLTNYQLASQDIEDKLVLLPSNWTAVDIEPAAGTEVRSNELVVVTMTKGG